MADREVWVGSPPVAVDQARRLLLGGGLHVQGFWQPCV